MNKHGDPFFVGVNGSLFLNHSPQIIKITTMDLSGLSLQEREIEYRRMLFSSSESKKTMVQKWAAIREMRDLYEDKVLQGDDWRAAYRFPELFGALERKKSELIDNLPGVKFRSSWRRDYDMAIGARAAVEHFDRVSNYKSALIDVISSAVEFGTGVLLNDVVDVKKMKFKTCQSTFLDYDGEMKTDYFGLAPMALDVRDVFPDPSATKCFDISGERGMDWCFIRRIYTWDQFCAKFKNIPGVSITEIKPKSWDSVEFMGYDRPNTKHESEEKEQSDAIYVVVFQGWHAIYGWNVIIANGKEIYLGANPFEHGRIPLVFYYNYKRDDSIWGVSEVELQAPFILAKELLANLMIDNAKFSQQPVTVVSGDVLFDPEQNELEPGAIWSLQGLQGGKIGDAVQTLTFNSSVEPAVAVKNMIEDMQIQVTGDDSRALFASPQELATQTLAKQESLKRRVRKNVMENSIRAEQESLWQKLHNIHQFLAKPYETVDGSVQYHEIYVDGFSTTQRNQTYRPVFTPVRGHVGVFKLNEKVFDPKYVSIEVYERVEDIVAKEQEMQALQWWFQTIAQMAQVKPEVMKNTDFEMLAKEAGKRFTDMDMDAIFNSTNRHIDGMDEFSYHVQQIAFNIKPVILRDGNNMRRLSQYRLFLKTAEYEKMSKESKRIYNQVIAEIVAAIREEKSVPFHEAVQRYKLASASGGNDKGPGNGLPAIAGGSVPGAAAQPNGEMGQP